jgi:hypothetical protein
VWCGALAALTGLVCSDRAAMLAALLIASMAALSLVALNAPFYGFLARRRGLLFACRALPVHWLYYAYSSGTFGVVWIRRRRAGPGSRQRAATCTRP